MLTTNNINPANYVNKSISQNSTINMKNFVPEMSKYVEVSDGNYIINPSIYLNKKISAKEISTLQTVLNKSNATAKRLGIKNLNVTNGNYVNNNDCNFTEIANGSNGIQFFWWGFYLSLNSVYTQMLINSGGTAYGIALGGALGTLTDNPIGIIGGAAVGGAIGSAIATYDDYSTEGVYGCVISYNYLEGVQEIWAQ